MRPSSISIRRGMRAAMPRSWVITTMVTPASWSSSSRARMAWPVAWSRLPVGSSASTMAGWPTRARAMATRWRCPPESWVGRAWAVGQTDEGEGVERAAGGVRPGDAGVEEPVGHVVEHGSGARPGRTAGTRSRCGWPAAPPARGRQSGDVEAGDAHGARGGAVEGAHQVQQGGLARPRRADDATSSPWSTVKLTPRARDGRLAGVDLGHLRRLRAPAAAALLEAVAGDGRGRVPHEGRRS